MRAYRLLLTPMLLLLLATTGCSAFGDKNIEQNYVLSVPDLHISTPSLPLHLQVMPVDVGPGLDTTRIAFVDNDVQMNYMADSKWAQPLPEMLQSLWIQALKESGIGATVSNDTDAEHADRVIHITADAFNAVRSNGGAINIRIHYEAIVTAPLTHKVLYVEDSFSEQSISAVSKADVMKGFNKANMQAMGDLIKKIAIDLRS